MAGTGAAYLLLTGGRAPVTPPNQAHQTCLRLHRAGARLVDEMGTPFRWRGITGFRLLELLATGRQREAEAYLDWCQSIGANLVRLFVTCQNLFPLSCEDGRRQLPLAHRLAAARGLYLESVCLTDTEGRDEDWAAHIEQCGWTLSEHPNSLIELVNEPGQHWQAFSPEQLQDFAAPLPETGVPFTLGAVDGDDDESRAYVWDPCSYFTVHASRLRAPWGNVRHVKEQADTAAVIRQFTINDEWGKDLHLGRQFAVGGICAVLGLGDTHHSDSLLHCVIPTGAERQAIEARRAAWDFVPDDWTGHFANVGWRAPLPVSPCASFVAIDEDSRVYSSVQDAEAYVVCSHIPAKTNSAGDANVVWQPGWWVLAHGRVGDDAHLYHLVR